MNTIQVILKTDDGYAKEIPWDDDIPNWVYGTKIEIYHSKYFWTAQYNVYSVSMTHPVIGLNHYEVNLQYIPGTRKYDTPPTTVDLTKQVADDLRKQLINDIQTEMDADIIKKILELSKHLKYD